MDEYACSRNDQENERVISKSSADDDEIIAVWLILQAGIGN